MTKDPRERLLNLREESLQGGGADRVAQQRKKGKLTARERLEILLDQGTFVELDKFVTHHSTGFGLEDKKILGDGVVTGYGRLTGGSSTSLHRTLPFLEDPSRRRMLERSARSWIWQFRTGRQ